MTIVIDGKSYDTIRGKTILDVCLENNLKLAHECEGKCTCGTCIVDILKGHENLSMTTSCEKMHLVALDANCRLACQTRIRGEVEVRLR
ncbi:MAG: (2Fe-2S)-binding protein [Bdellovibrionales bacterium]|nr:(2Fe-2S)-binding protein [Bdellovibrionales bacterium]